MGEVDVETRQDLLTPPRHSKPARDEEAGRSLKEHIVPSLGDDLGPGYCS
jgi:hypothetical protein